MKWVREAPSCKITGPDGYKYEPVWMHPTDAEARGIKYGDVVEVFNERGRVPVRRLRHGENNPGALSIDTALGTIHVPGVLDRGGAINTICRQRPPPRIARAWS